MYQRLSKLRARRAAGESGFTLIELLVVVVIIGILIAIAIPVYLNYQKGAKDKSADSDLRNAISVLEQCNSDNNGYPGGVAGGANGLTAALTAPGVAGTACSQTINLTAGTTIGYALSGTVPAYYEITSTNTGGSGKQYCYSSGVGGSIKTETTPVTIALTGTTGNC